MKLLQSLFLCVAIAGLFLPANAFAIKYTAQFDGVSESPSNASPGTGFAEVDLDTILHTLSVEATFSGLIGTTTTAHIHAPTAAPGTGTAGVATQLPVFEGFPLNVTSGSYSHIFDTTLDSTFSPAFLTANGGTAAGAEAALAATLADGTAYFNIHTTEFPPGEIRGFLTEAASQPIPEPTTAILLGGGLAGLVVFGRKKRKL